MRKKMMIDKDKPIGKLKRVKDLFPSPKKLVIPKKYRSNISK